VLEAPIISQVWDSLETPGDGHAGHPSQPRRSLSDGTASPAAEVDGVRRLSIKNLFKQRSSRPSSSANRQSQLGDVAAPSTAESAEGDDTQLLTNRVLAGIPTTEIDLANYIVAHGILNKQLR